MSRQDLNGSGTLRAREQVGDKPGGPQKATNERRAKAVDEADREAGRGRNRALAGRGVWADHKLRWWPCRGVLLPVDGPPARPRGALGNVFGNVSRRLAVVDAVP